MSGQKSTQSNWLILVLSSDLQYSLTKYCGLWYCYLIVSIVIWRPLVCVEVWFIDWKKFTVVEQSSSWGTLAWGLKWCFWITKKTLLPLCIPQVFWDCWLCRAQPGWLKSPPYLDYLFPLGPTDLCAKWHLWVTDRTLTSLTASVSWTVLFHYFQLHYFLQIFNTFPMPLHLIPFFPSPLSSHSFLFCSPSDQVKSLKYVIYFWTILQLQIFKCLKHIIKIIIIQQVEYLTCKELSGIQFPEFHIVPYSSTPVCRSGVNPDTASCPFSKRICFIDLKLFECCLSSMFYNFWI